MNRSAQAEQDDRAAVDRWLVHFVRRMEEVYTDHAEGSSWQQLREIGRRHASAECVHTGSMPTVDAPVPCMAEVKTAAAASAGS